MSAITLLSSGLLQSLLNNVTQGTGPAASQSKTSAVSQSNDQSGLSPFAQLMSTLQQLQQSNPTEYQQVTAQIATNLQSAAKTAQSDGNTTEANQLTQLSTDFTNASKSGQLPNAQDLAQAVGGHHHHHHGHPASSDSDSDSGSSSSSGGSASTNQALTQLISAFQANSAQSQTLNPMDIILNTLSNAGIGAATS